MDWTMASQIHMLKLCCPVWYSWSSNSNSRWLLRLKGGMGWVLIQWDRRGLLRGEGKEEGEICLHTSMEDRSCEDIARKRLPSGQEENSLYEQLNLSSTVTLDFIFRPVWKQFFCLFYNTQSMAFCYINISSLRKCTWVSQRRMSALQSSHFAHMCVCTYVCKCTHTFVHS